MGYRLSHPAGEPEFRWVFTLIRRFQKPKPLIRKEKWSAVPPPGAATPTQLSLEGTADVPWGDFFRERSFLPVLLGF